MQFFSNRSEGVPTRNSLIAAAGIPIRKIRLSEIYFFIMICKISFPNFPNILQIFRSAAWNRISGQIVRPFLYAECTIVWGEE